MPIWTKNKDGIFTSSKANPLSYPSDGNNDCFAVESVSPWFLQRNELINHFIDKYPQEGDFLDIGAGNGFQSKSIIENGYKNKVIVCEPGFNGCLNSKKNGIKYVYNGLFQDFPFNKFNISACGLFDVIEHVEDDVTFLNLLYKKVKKGTLIFINVPALKHLWSETDNYAGHYRRYNLKDLKRIENNTNFKVIDYTYFFNHFYLPLFILRVLPFKIGIKKSNDKIKKDEINNLKRKDSVINSIINYMHELSMLKLKKNKKISFGTSLFFLLKKL